MSGTKRTVVYTITARKLCAVQVVYWERATSVHNGTGGVAMHGTRDEYDEGLAAWWRVGAAWASC